MIFGPSREISEVNLPSPQPMSKMFRGGTLQNGELPFPKKLVTRR